MQSLTKKKKELLERHFINLIRHKFINEVKFLIEKGMKLNCNSIMEILKTCNTKMIDYLETIANKNSIQEGFDELIYQQNWCYKYLIEKEGSSQVKKELGKYMDLDGDYFEGI